VGRRGIDLVDQARVDGARGGGVLTAVLLPLAAPALLASVIVVTMLALFEVVLSQIVAPVGYPSIALALLNHMHYARDDMVISTSLVIVPAGIAVTQVCGWLLWRSSKRESENATTR
jgi:ABC-type spermidine/putrescine transport system permease subunit II